MQNALSIEMIRDVSEPYQTSKMKCFAEIVENKNSLNILAKHSILDVWQGSEYASDHFDYHFDVKVLPAVQNQNKMKGSSPNQVSNMKKTNIPPGFVSAFFLFTIIGSDSRLTEYPSPLSILILISN